MARIRIQLRAVLADTRHRVRTRWRSAFFRALRLSGAGVASWLVANALSPNSDPILASLTALLVVQVTLYGTLRSGIQRVISVMAGVLLAVGFTAVVGLTWWSLGALIAVSITLGQLLKLGPNLIEVPISAMLVLAVGAGAAQQTALGRISETLVGALVGVAVNVLFPPAVRTLDAGARVERFAARIAELLDDAAADLSAGRIQGAAEQWLEEARRLTRHVPGIEQDIADAEQSRQLNLRALGTPRTVSSLRDGLEALEHSLVAVRSMFRSIADGMSADREGEDPYARDVREAFALLLHDLADCFAAYGRMVRAQVDDDPEAEATELATALRALREARARVSEMLLLGPRTDPEFWELNVSLLATVERVLRELDVEEYVRERSEHLAEQEVGLSHHAAERIRLRSRRVAEHLGELGEQLGELGDHFGDLAIGPDRPPPELPDSPGEHRAPPPG